MKIKVSYDRGLFNKTVELNESDTVKQLLYKLKINPVTVIVSRNRTIITREEKIKDKDNINIISVLSGG